MLHDNYLFLVESDRLQIKEVRSKTQMENLETKATPKRVWINPTCSASIAFSRQQDKNEKVIVVFTSLLTLTFDPTIQAPLGRREDTKRDRKTRKFFLDFDFASVMSEAELQN